MVGSALVRTIEEHGHRTDLEDAVEQFTRTLAGGLARGAAR